MSYKYIHRIVAAMFSLFLLVGNGNMLAQTRERNDSLNSGGPMRGYNPSGFPTLALRYCLNEFNGTVILNIPDSYKKEEIVEAEWFFTYNGLWTNNPAQYNWFALSDTSVYTAELNFDNINNTAPLTGVSSTMNITVNLRNINHETIIVVFDGFVVHKTPNEINFIQTDIICYGGSVKLELPSSENGFIYQLMRDSSPIGDKQTGDGNSIDFTVNNITETGIISYWVNAYNPQNEDCTQKMPGYAIVTVLPLPDFSLLSNINCIGAGKSLDVQTSLTHNPDDPNNDNDNDYTYSWSGTGPEYTYEGSSDKNLSIPQGKLVNAGEYTFTLTVTNNNYTGDLAGCPASKSVTVTVNENPEVTIDPVDPLCEGTTLTITPNVNKGMGPYIYKWYKDDIEISTAPAYSKPNITTADAGEYKVIVTDANDCGSDTATVEVVVNPLPDVIVASNTPVCEGDTIKLMATEMGAGNYSYEWLYPNGNSSNEQNPVIADATSEHIGSYTLTVTDNSNGTICKKIYTVTVVVNSKPEFAPSADTPVCEGEDVELKGNIETPASDILSIEWSGTNVVNGNTEDITVSGLTASSYMFELTVKTTDGCEATDSIEVIVHPRFEVTIDSENPYCAGNAISLQANISGGEGSSEAVYHYLWQFSASQTPAESDFTDISNSDVATLTVTNNATTTHQGTYRVIVTTESNTVCNATDAVYIEVNPKPIFNLYTVKQGYCPEETLTISVINLPAGNYKYEWYLGGSSVGGNSDTYSVAEVDASNGGTYKVRVTDMSTESQCYDEEEILITIYAKPEITFPVDPVEVCEGGVFSITPNVEPGTADDYIYSWILPDNTASADNPTLTRTATDSLQYSGTYKLVVKNDAIGGCNSDTAKVNVVVYKPIEFDLVADKNPVCVGDEVKLSVIDLTGGSGEYTYSWSGPNGILTGDTTVTITVADKNFAGTYSVTVNDKNGNICPGGVTHDVDLDVHTPITFTLTSAPQPVVCQGNPITLEITGLTGGSGSYTYVWSGPDGEWSASQTIEEGATSIPVGNATGTMLPPNNRFTVKITDDQENICAKVVEKFTDVIVHPLPVANAGEDIVICEDEDLILGNNVVLVTGYTYTWKDSGNNEISSLLNDPEFTVIPTPEPGVYSYFLTVYDGNCESQPDTVVVTVEPKPEVTFEGNPELCFNPGGAWYIEAIPQPAGVDYVNWEWYRGTEDGPTGNPLQDNDNDDTKYSKSNVEDSDAGWYWVSFTDPNTEQQCMATQGIYITVKKVNATINLNPTTPPSPYCEGDDIKFTAAPVGVGYKYEFFVILEGGDTISKQGPSSDHIYPLVLNADEFGAEYASVNVYVQVTTDKGCIGESTRYPITINKRPVADLIAPQHACVGDTVIIEATEDWHSAYIFSVDGIAQPLSMSHIFKYPVTEERDDYVFTVEITSKAGCKAVSSPKTVTVHALPEIELTSFNLDNPVNPTSTEICLGNNIQFTASEGTEYKFMIGDSIVQEFDENYVISTDTLTVSQTVTVIGRDDYCSNTVSINIEVITEATLVITPEEYCADEPVQLVVEPQGGSSYHFYNIDGTLLPDNTGSNGYNLTPPLIHGAQYYAVVTYASGCQFSTDPVTLNVKPFPTITFTVDDAEVCAGDPVTFTATGGVFYDFYIVGNPNNPVQSSDNSVFSPDYLQNNDGVYVKVTGNNGCSVISDTIHVTVNPLPKVTLTIQGEAEDVTTVCPNMPVIFEATIEGETSSLFTFYHKRGESILEQQGENTSNTFTPAEKLESGDKIIVEGRNASECTNSDSIVITVANPEAVITPDKGYEICENTTVTLTASEFHGQTVTEARFYLLGNPDPIENVTPLTVEVTPQNNEKYYVVITAGFDCVAYSDTITFTVSDLPTPTLEIDGGDNEICVNEPITFIAGDGDGDTTYEFTFRDENDVEIRPVDSNDAADAFTTTFLQAGKVYVTVKVTNSAGCDSTLQIPVEVIVNELPQFNLMPNPAFAVEDTPIDFYVDIDDTTKYTYQYYLKETITSDFVPVSTWSKWRYENPQNEAWVKVVVKNIDTDCENEDSVQVTVEEKPEEIPLVAENNITAYCEGESGVTLYLDGEPESDVTYYLVTTRPTDPDNINGIEGTVNIGNNRIEWTGVKGTTTYHVFAIRNNAFYEFEATVTIIENPKPVAYQMVPTGEFECESKTIRLPYSESGITYYLQKDGDLLENTRKSGIDGGELVFGEVSVGGTYTILAIDERYDTKCATVMDGELTINTPPVTQFDLNADPEDATYCEGEAGVTLTLSGSETNEVSIYYLYMDGVQKYGIAATGEPIKFYYDENNNGKLDDEYEDYFFPAGVYNVMVQTGNCLTQVGKTVEVRKLQTPQSLTVRAENDGEFCAESEGVRIFMDNPEKGVEYTLHFGGELIETEEASDTPANPIDFGVYNNAGVYIVKGSYPNHDCPSVEVGSVTLTELQLPIAYEVTGSGGFCVDDETAAANVILSRSETGFEYALYKDDDTTPVQTQESITGGVLTFYVREAGTYTIKAKNQETGCSREMNGSATIEAYQSPHLPLDVEKIEGLNCTEGDVITIKNPEDGVTYLLAKFNGVDYDITTIEADNEGVFPPVIDTEAKYRIYAVSSKGCGVYDDEDFDIDVPGAITKYKVIITDGGNICEDYDEPIEIGLDDSQADVKYTLYKEDVAAPLATELGTGSPFTFTVTEPLDEGIYFVMGEYVVPPAAEACSNEVGRETLTKYPLPNNVTIEFAGMAVPGKVCSGLPFRLIATADVDGSVKYQFFRIREGNHEPLNDEPSTTAYIEIKGDNVMLGDQYYVVAYSQYGCRGESPATDGIEIIERPDVTLTPEDVEICVGTPITFEAIVNNFDPSADYYYTFMIVRSTTYHIAQEGSDNLFYANNPVNPNSSLKNGDFLIVIVSNKYGCSAGSEVITVKVNELPEITLDIDPVYSATIKEGKSFTFTALPWNADYEYIFMINDEDVDVSLHDRSSNEWTYSPKDGEEISVRVLYKGCGKTSEDTYLFTVETQPKVTLQPEGPLYYCENTDGVTLYISSIETNVKYTLINDDDSEWGVGTDDNGDGIIEWNNVKEGFYRVKAKREGGLYTEFISNTVEVIENPLPNGDYNISPEGTQSCGVQISLSGSEEGVTYYLVYNGEKMLDTATPGDGGQLNFGPVDKTGTYKIVGVDDITGCETEMNGETVIVSNLDMTQIYLQSTPPSPVILCDDDNEPVEIYIENSYPGLYYLECNDRLVENEGFINENGNRFPFGNYSEPGIYKAYLEYDGCLNYVNGTVEIRQGTEPFTGFEVTAHNDGHFCAGSTGVLWIEISGREANVTYQLFAPSDATTPVAELTPTTATDHQLPLRFEGPYSETGGVYTVKAVPAEGDCVVEIGTILLVEEVLPAVVTIKASNDGICEGESTMIYIEDTDPNLEYLLYRNRNGSPLEVKQGGGRIEFSGVSQRGFYTVKVRNTFGCMGDHSEDVFLEVKPMPDINSVSAEVTYQGTDCSDGDIITVRNTQQDAIYSLVKEVAGDFVSVETNIIIEGDGSDKEFKPIIDKDATYWVVANLDGCEQWLKQPLTIDVPGAVKLQTLFSEGDACLLGSGIVIGLDDSEAGVTYALYYEDETDALIAEVSSGGRFTFNYNVLFDGKYYVKAIGSDGCDTEMVNGVEIKHESMPNSFVLEGNGVSCDGGGAELSLAASEYGITYILMRIDAANNSTHIKVTEMEGTGSRIIFNKSYVKIEGQYQAYALNKETGCASSMSNIITVRTVPNAPTAGTVAVHDKSEYCNESEGGSLLLTGVYIDMTYILIDVYTGSTVAMKVADTTELRFDGILEGDYEIFVYNGAYGEDGVYCKKKVNGTFSPRKLPAPDVPVLEAPALTCELPVIIKMTEAGQSGVIYRLIHELSGEEVGESKTGNGTDILTWEIEADEFYYIKAEWEKNECFVVSETVMVEYDGIDSFTAEVSAYTYCQGEQGVTIGISNHQEGVDYWLTDAEGNTVGVLVADKMLTEFEGLFGEGTYYITGKNQHCESIPVEVNITMLEVPAVPVLNELEPSCEMPVIITTATPGEPGVVYHLIRDLEIDMGVPRTGDGENIMAWEIEEEDFYHIETRTEECAVQSNTIEVVIHEAIDTISVNSTYEYCQHEGGAAIEISKLQPGVIYLLKDASDNLVSFLDGNGNETQFIGRFGAGEYTIKGQYDYCEAELAEITITELPAPAPFTLGSRLDGNEYEIFLSGSELGVDYTLYRNSEEFVATVQGTGDEISFGKHTAPGIYTAKAVNVTTLCEKNMDGEVVIEVELPGGTVELPDEGFLSYCNDTENIYSGAIVTVKLTQVGLEYQTVDETGEVFDYITGNGSRKSFNRPHTAGFYTLVVRDFSASTRKELQVFEVKEYSMPALYDFVSGNGIVYDSEIVLNGAETGVSYSLYRKNTAETPPVANPADLYLGVEENPVMCEEIVFCDSLNFGTATDAGYYYVQATGAGGCASWMNGTMWIIESPLIARNDTLYLGPNDLTGTINVSLNDILLPGIDDINTNILFEPITDDGELFGKPYSSDYILNEASGEFHYEKLPSFFGVDSVAYRISNTEIAQRSSIAKIYIRVGNKDMPGDAGSFLLPNAFSPNGDGINDVFIISGLGVTEESSLEVFNRWGTIVYRSSGTRYENNWNGTANVSAMISIGSELPNGTYYYVFKVKKNVDGRIESRDYNGFVELRR